MMARLFRAFQKQSCCCKNASERPILIDACVWDFLNKKCIVKLRQKYWQRFIKVNHKPRNGQKISWQLRNGRKFSWKLRWFQHPHPDPLKQSETYVYDEWRGDEEYFNQVRFAKMFIWPSASVAVIFFFGRILMISGECSLRKLSHFLLVCTSTDVKRVLRKRTISNCPFFFALKYEALLHNFKPMYYIDHRETIQVGLSFVKNSTNVEKKKAYRYVA